MSLNDEVSSVLAIEMRISGCAMQRRGIRSTPIAMLECQPTTRFKGSMKNKSMRLLLKVAEAMSVVMEHCLGRWGLYLDMDALGLRDCCVRPT